MYHSLCSQRTVWQLFDIKGVATHDLKRGTHAAREYSNLMGERTSMVKGCVAAGCSNTYREGVSLLLFPKDHARWLQWIKQVQQTRAVILCSDYFIDDCCEPDYAIASSLGLDKLRRRLTADAVPTIFNTNPDGSQSKKVRRGAYEKRERVRVCFITIM